MQREKSVERRGYTEHLHGLPLELLFVRKIKAKSTVAICTRDGVYILPPLHSVKIEPDFAIPGEIGRPIVSYALGVPLVVELLCTKMLDQDTMILDSCGRPSNEASSCWDFTTQRPDTNKV